MSFDQQAFIAHLKQKFASVAGAEDLLQELAFQENFQKQFGGGSSPDLALMKTLEENVPDIEPHVMIVAILAGQPMSMVYDSGMRDGMTAEARALYDECRKNVHGVSPESSAELKQIVMARMITNIETLEEAYNGPQRHKMRYASVMQLSSMANRVAWALTDTGAPELEKLFKAKNTFLQSIVQNFFADPAPKP